MTIQKCGTKQIESPTLTFVWTFNWSTGVLILHHKIVKFPDGYYRMEKILSEEEKQRINVLLEKHQPRKEIQEKEMVVLSEKGKDISIKTEVASSSMKPFEDWPVEHEEEASKRKYEVIGTDIETEYEDMDTEDEEHEVKRLTKQELEMYHQYKEFYTIQARTKGRMPSFGYIHRLEVKEHYPGVPTHLVKTFSHPVEGEVQDINQMPEQEIIKIEQKHAMVPRRWVNIRPEKKTIILCIDPDSDSDVIIEEEEGDFRERCILTRGNEWNVEEEAEQADDEWLEPLITEETEPGMSLAADQETEDKDETISSTSTQDYDREKVEREFINLASHYQQIRESFKKLVEEVPHMKKWQLATNLAKMPILPMIKIEKVSSMYGQCYEEEPSQVQEECDPEVYGENAEKKLQSIINSIGDQSALFLMAVGDCIVNKKSQAEVATKYNIPRSRIQRAMSGKKEHRKGGKQYQQERKRKPSEEDSTRSWKTRRNEKELERIDDKPTLDIEDQNSKEDSDKQLDVQL